MKIVKSLDQFVSELNDQIPGGISDKLTPQDIADKHSVSLEEIEAALDKGQKVEMEHTDDAEKAREIAKDHLLEDPQYYEKLAKMEGEPTNEAAKVETERYFRSHMKQPKGYGKWMFSYNKNGDDPFEIPGSMSYADAAKWVKAKAKEDGKDYIYVMEGINDFSPLSYAKKVANKIISLADAAKEADMPQTELLKLVRKFDKNFKMTYEANDHEVGMAQGQLDAIHKDAAELQEKIGAEERDLPGWIQSHITSAYEYLKQANDNFHELKEEEKVDEALINEEKTASEKLADEVSGELYKATLRDNSATVTATTTTQMWDDGVPVLKYLARGKGKPVKMEKKVFDVVHDVAHGWFYFSDGRKWFGLHVSDGYADPSDLPFDVKIAESVEEAKMPEPRKDEYYFLVRNKDAKDVWKMADDEFGNDIDRGRIEVLFQKNKYVIKDFELAKRFYQYLRDRGVKFFDQNFVSESVEVNEALKMLMDPLMLKIMKQFGFKADPGIRAELKAEIQAAVEEVLKKHDIVVEGTFNDGEIAIYTDPRGDAGETQIFKRGKGYYGRNDSFDFEAKDKKELEMKLKRWGYVLIAGSIDEAFQAEAEEPLAKLALSLLAIRDQAHMFHWQTQSYEQHMAFGEFYEDFIGKMDELMENIMGKSERPAFVSGTITLAGYSDSEVIEFINTAKNVFDLQLPTVVPTEGNSEIYNLVEEILSMLNKLQYLLSLK